MRVVLDTNIIVAAVIAPEGYTAQILRLAEEHAFEVSVSGPVLEEYEATLNRPDIQRRHHLSSEAISQEIIGGIREFSLLVEPTVKLEVVVADPDDNKFIECAVAGNAEVIVSADPDLLYLESYDGIQIVKPPVFLHILSQQDAA
ncbi:MAG: putative toxin-antitoxin system toxin component, PIN family [Candidatus Levyibacteriota bacterium]